MPLRLLHPKQYRYDHLPSSLHMRSTSTAGLLPAASIFFNGADPARIRFGSSNGCLQPHGRNPFHPSNHHASFWISHHEIWKEWLNNICDHLLNAHTCAVHAWTHAYIFCKSIGCITIEVILNHIMHLAAAPPAPLEQFVLTIAPTQRTADISWPSCFWRVLSEPGLGHSAALTLTWFLDSQYTPLIYYKMICHDIQDVQGINPQ